MIYKDKNKFERDAILLIRRTQRGRKFIVNLGEGHPKFFKWLGNLGVIVGFAVSIYGMVFLIDIIIKILVTEVSIPGLAAVVPTTASTASIGPGYFAIPFWYWIIPIALLAIVHEGMHGIMFAREKLKIKSLGVGLLLVIPLAFVEPDEKELVKKKTMQQMRIFAAGSFGNFMLAGAVFLIFSYGVTGLFTPVGVAPAGLIEGYPAADANLTGIITKMNGFEIHSRDELTAVLKNIGINENVRIETITINEDGSRETHVYNIITVAPPPEHPDQDTGFIGVTFSTASDIMLIKDEFGGFEGEIYFLSGLLQFIILINLGVGIFNLLPIKPLDGGRMWELVFNRISPKRGARITRWMSYITLLIIILNFTLPFIKPLFM
ncbi:MAG: site-2 protease family protein [Candidatus Aenigmatarchaeota archaeon]|nr:site-2 protease family protein [Nanoarchaeota archaeon]